MKTTLVRMRILYRDIGQAEGTMDDFLRCYAKLRERAEKMELTQVAADLDKAVLGARDLINASARTRITLSDAMNQQRALRGIRPA